MSSQKIKFILVLIISIFFAIGIYFFLKSEGVFSPIKGILSEDQSAIVAADSTSSLGTKFPDTEPGSVRTIEKTKMYENTSRGFSLKFPENLSVKEYDEGDGTKTIVFENAENKNSFQIFFTPYLGDTITKSRILKDVPSGQFTSPVEVVLGDGTHALAFVSTQTVGKMREVWFIRDGFLYEVTTFDDLDSWLAGIMQSWVFHQK